MANTPRKRCKKGMQYSKLYGGGCIKKSSVKRAARLTRCSPGTARRYSGSTKYGCLSQAAWDAQKQANRQARCPYGWNDTKQSCMKGNALQRREHKASQRRSKVRAGILSHARKSRRKSRMANTRKFIQDLEMDRLSASLGAFHVSKPKRRRTRKKKSTKKSPRRSPGGMRKHIMGMNMAGLMGGPLY